MVLVTCLNPAVDKTALVAKARGRGRMRLDRVLSLPGGKGINVARALRGLGERAVIVGWTAGHAGAWIEAAVRREGLNSRWTRIAAGESRLCLSVADGKGLPLDLNEVGPNVGRRDLRRLEKVFRSLLPRCRLVVLSGSLPPGCPPAFYARLVTLAHSFGRPVFVDASLAALRLAVRSQPDLIKINREEARALISRSGRRDLWSLLAQVRRLGPSGAVVTMGALGAAGLIQGRRLRAIPPKIRAVTPIGCGDTFMAGLVYSRLRGWSAGRSLAFATALATASAMVPGAGVFRKLDLRRVRPRVVLR